MSEKRFVLDYEDDDTIFIDDNKLKKHLTIRNVKIKIGDLNDIVDRLNQLDGENEQLRQQSENYRKSRDKWRTRALQKEEQLKDCDNDCFNCRFYNKICDFCTKFNITSSTSGE